MRFLLLFGLFMVVSFAGAQELIRGIVVDSATFAGLPNVNVQLAGTFRGTITDSKGNFSIHARKTDTLVLTRVGYRRVDLPLFDYEPGMIRMGERETLLAPIVIHDSRLYANPYEGIFDEEAAALKERIPFYYARSRKDKIKASRWREESLRVKTYMDVVINDPETRNGLMKKYGLNEKDYYNILTQFNEKHYQVMYFLTASELRSLINKFFEYSASSR